MEEIRTLLEEPTSQFLTNETEVTGITSEVTRLKVESMNMKKYINEPENCCIQLLFLFRKRNDRKEGESTQGEASSILNLFRNRK